MFVRINQAIDASRLRREEGEKGFTLIELLVVVLIIGVLSAIAIPIFLNQQKSAKLASIEADLSSAKTAIVAQLVAEGDFPTAGVIGSATNPIVGWSASNGVTLTLIGNAEGFCIEGVHVDYPDGGDDARHVLDTGGVLAGECS